MELRCIMFVLMVFLSCVLQVSHGSLTTAPKSTASNATTVATIKNLIKNATHKAVLKPVVKTKVKHVNSTSTKSPQLPSTSSSDTGNENAKGDRKMNFTAIGLRAFYVITVLCGVIVIYFGVRYVCSQRRRSRTKKYGRLRNGQDMELQRLSEGDEDDDDLTLFDASQRKGKSRR